MFVLYVTKYSTYSHILITRSVSPVTWIWVEKGDKAVVVCFHGGCGQPPIASILHGQEIHLILCKFNNTVSNNLSGKFVHYR